MNLETITNDPTFQIIADMVEGNLIFILVGIAALYFATALFALRTQVRARGASAEARDLSGKVAALEVEIAELRAELVRVRAHGEARAVQPPSPTDEVALQEEVSVAPPPPIEPTPPSKPVSVEDVVVEPPSSIKRGMAKSRSSFLGKLRAIFGGKNTADLSILDDLEEALISSDVGAKTTDALLVAVREQAANNEISEDLLRDLLKSGVRRELINVDACHRLYSPSGSPLVVLVVGVNGVGKTTTVAKLATRYQAQGKKVLAVAADTFRAAAVQQLKEWGGRKGFEVYAGAENAKPAAVVFDGMVAAKEKGVDVVLIDTAGRLHTKTNLMQELEGVRNSIRRHIPDAPHETILVVDGVSGQNALMQARDFNASTPLTGLVVTKLDGTPKGGIIVAISQELKIPVVYVGVGEKAEDLLPFSPDEFVEGLFSGDAEGVSAAASRAGAEISHGAQVHQKVVNKE